MIFTWTTDISGFVSEEGFVCEKGFVSGHRFSDAASPSKPNAPSGAATAATEDQQ
jgi:hypothetical protein